MSVTYRITLDLAKETDNAIYGLKVGETGEKIIKVALNENGKALQFDAGESVQLQIKKPDGNIILKDATRVNNLCTFSFSGTNTQQLTAVAGECEAEVVVFGDNFNKSCRFSLFVEEGVISEDEIESTSIYVDLEEAKERYESIVQKAVKKDIIQNIFGYISGNDLIVNYYGYSNDNIAFRTLTADVTSINDSVVYLYQDTSNNWAVSFETPSSYNLAPAPIGKVKSYWIGNGTVKHFYPLNTVDICHDFYSNFSQIYATKQNAEQGKGLSTNDFTNELKATLENIAQTFITNTVNNLTNYYLKSETYSKSEVNQLIGAIPKFKIEVVNQLPTTDISTATVYLVTTGAESQNLYTEYIYVNNAWEKLGTQTVDLTGYATQTWVGSYIQSAFNSTLSNFYNKQEVDTALGNKVDKITGKGLSTEDYTTAEKNKLAGIEDGAEANVQSDWSQSNSSADDFIKNKPANLVQDSSYVHTDNNFNNDYKSKIETNEYNDILNIRVEWDRSYMPNAELIAINFQGYENGILVNEVLKYNVKDITNGSVYLYKNIGDSWQIAVGTPPSSYHRLPMLVGKIATKTVNGESVKLFFRNDDDETQFDELNSEKVNKQNMSLLCSRTVVDTGETLPSIYTFNQDDNGNTFNLSMAQVVVYVPSGANQGGAIGFYKNDNRTGPIYQYAINNIRQVSANSWFDIKTEIQNGFWTSTPKGTSAVFLSTDAPKTELTAGSYKIKSIDVTAWGSSVIPVGSVIRIYGINEVTA